MLELIERHKKVVNIIHEVSSKVNSSLDLDTIFSSAFNLLDQYFEFKHIMIFLVDKKDPSQLRVAASHGYDGKGIGAVLPIGKGVVGIVAKNKKLLRMGGIQLSLTYIKAASASDVAADLIDQGLDHGTADRRRRRRTIQTASGTFR